MDASISGMEIDMPKFEFIGHIYSPLGGQVYPNLSQRGAAAWRYPSV
jgi:hypothetical protein